MESVRDGPPWAVSILCDAIHVAALGGDKVCGFSGVRYSQVDVKKQGCRTFLIGEQALNCGGVYQAQGAKSLKNGNV